MGYCRGKAPFENGELVNWLKKNQEKNRSRAYDSEVKESKKAELTYRLLEGADTIIIWKFNRKQEDITKLEFN